MSHEYTGAIVIVIVSLLKLIGKDIPEAELTPMVSSFLTLILGIYVMYRRYGKGDITPLGGRKKKVATSEEA